MERNSKQKEKKKKETNKKRERPVFTLSESVISFSLFYFSFLVLKKRRAERGRMDEKKHRDDDNDDDFLLRQKAKNQRYGGMKNGFLLRPDGPVFTTKISSNNSRVYY